ncbi:hypothetical protein EJ377_00895 [Chryseobacterium arthrosphaerae]|uniref:Uncharacterized protein n=1 Tax=Chryseobacterium arthrosphaerae TaxID=651561 RepID=A0A3S0QVE3_9FLAO|nr:hypothetical protein EJ377_00895 [Chryseobacterium arthrosphaerae]
MAGYPERNQFMGNSRTTAEIIYIFMNSGKSWTTPEADKATIIWAVRKWLRRQNNSYLKQAVYSDKVNKSWVSYRNKTRPGIAQGGLFWQYYENLEM